jgi:uncharacterized protein (DUF924 family)
MAGHAMIADRIEPHHVLDFWFTERVQRLCFERNDAFDAELRDLFGAAVAEAQAGGFEAWRATPDGTLALLILLDQMSRNIYRDSPQAFAADPRALAIAVQAVEAGFDRRFPFPKRRFVYLPFEHSEDPAVQKRALALFSAVAVECAAEHNVDAAVQLIYAARHAEIVFRFGRYPHRNAVLGRASTPEEEAFLKEPLSSF